jgi:hypothetical protein
MTMPWYRMDLLCANAQQRTTGSGGRCCPGTCYASPGRPLAMESEQENRRGILRLAYVAATIGEISGRASLTAARKLS